METKKAVLVLVDISGYTHFIRAEKMSAIHAEEIIFDLLEAVVESADHPLIFNKVEGDAVLLFAKTSGDEVEVARSIASQVRAFFDVFYEWARFLAHERAECSCNACQRVLDLKIKAFIHHGEVVFKQFRQFLELAGEDVIITHRLAKNAISSSEYILITEAFFQLTGNLPGMYTEPFQEVFQDVGVITGKVLYRSASNKDGIVQSTFTGEK